MNTHFGTPSPPTLKIVPADVVDISATRQKFSQPATDADKPATSVSRTKLDTTTDIHLKTKKVDLGQLIQKFSGSESASERSDTDADSWASAGGHRPWVRRQKAEEINSSSEESEGARRTPERTQSLRHYGGPPPNSSSLGSKLEKSASFRAEFASRRLAQKASDSVVQAGGTREITPPKENAARTAPSSASSASAAASSSRALSAEKTFTKSDDDATKDLSGTFSVPTGADAGLHSKRDTPTRATFSGSIKRDSPEPSSGSNSGLVGLAGSSRTVSGLGGVSTNKDRSSSADPRLTELSSSTFMNRPWLNRTPGSGLQSRNDNHHARDDKTSVVVDIAVPPSKGQESSSLKHAAEPDKQRYRNSLDSVKSVDMNSLDKSMELLSKVTEELDHPERPSSLPSSPLDLRTPKSKSRSPSIDEAQRYIKDVETSISSISSRGSPEKTKSPVRSRFPFRLSDEGKIAEINNVEESDKQTPLPRESRLGQQQGDSKASRLSSDPKSSARDVSVNKSEDTPVSLVSHDFKDSRHLSRDSKSFERDVKADKSTVNSDSLVSRDLTSSHLSRDLKSSERESKADRQPAVPLGSHVSRDDITSHVLRDPKSLERETKYDKQPTDERDLAKVSSSVTRDSGRSSLTASTLSTAGSLPTFTPASASSSQSEPPKPQDGGSKDLAEPEASSSGMRRTSSFKDPAELTEKRKGILKRASSLKSRGDPTSHPVVDPQLARILQQRKAIVGDVLEEEEEKEDKDKKRTFSATEEIQENLKYSIQKAAELGRNPEEDDALKRMSVAERVQYMQTKLEEEKYSVTSSRSRSGLSTPRSRPVSGLITPSQLRYEEPHQPHMSSSSSATSISGFLTTGPPPPAAPGSRKNSTSSFPAADGGGQQGSSAVSGPRLIEKLTAIAEASDAFQERRHRYQQRSRNDWRHQTQPVTLEEISAVDSREAVSNFRALVRKKTSINAFDQLKDQSGGGNRQQVPLVGKKAEFPQHLPPPPKNQRRGRRLRHRTLPVTAEELNAVPEHQMLIMHPDWAKTEDLEEKRDSGILSGSDVDLLQDQPTAFTTDLDSGDKEPSKMTISAKTSFFKSLEERSRADREKSASGAKRWDYLALRQTFCHYSCNLRPVICGGEVASWERQCRIYTGVGGKQHLGPPKQLMGPPKKPLGPPKQLVGPPKQHLGPPKQHLGPP
ncbi:hypothetical protein Btru_006607 [Bulinus truncatus]|nr:hypothetical protein Btru_006607 [Bulinus truncatus]